VEGLVAESAPLLDRGGCGGPGRCFRGEHGVAAFS
jgi:hypothetical protein